MFEYHPYKQGEASKSKRTESPCTNDSGTGSVKSTQSAKASKRIRGEIACAECRRLKIKCDRLVPCSTCVKRGCQTLCPTGTIPPGQGSRFVLAATDHLHRKLAKFEARMHSLEDALTIAHTTYNLEPHPLLSDREDIYTDTQELKPMPEASEDEADLTPYISGSLHVNGSGLSRFFGPSGTSLYGPHELALLYIVLAIGVLVDLSIEPLNLESQHFYHLARAALVLQPVLTESSVTTIKVLHMMSIHNGLSSQENLEQSYALINLAGQIATQIGFHIDPSTWKFQGREAYDRRVYWWNLLAGILWNSLVTGRPSGIFAEFITCKIPTVEEENMYQRGEFPLGFGVWGFHTTYTCLLPLVHITLSTKPSYEKVLELDAKIRTLVNPKPDSDPSDDRTAISMRTFVRSHYSHLMLLYLHRPSFSLAMTEHTANPLMSPYGKSVLTAYHAACAVLDDTRIQYQKKPLLVCRVWQIWSFAFSAAVIVGTVATNPNCLDVKPHPLEQFESACEVFRGAAEVSSRAAQALLVLNALLQKAIEIDIGINIYLTHLRLRLMHI
ncbi:hypothetical protein LENED_000993 [Lentinula edodes]|uniref:Zn(2)-C6 fungal-type domain-containing protein n=1 Tax=Lentinula edodes TaxID=5353 RepID=A0A1Q3DX03_LENED|nr:hypothetical protein LENED_000993 [Lentinula edodes]